MTSAAAAAPAAADQCPSCGKESVGGKGVDSAAAEDLVRARNRFVANMSHELRTPLNSVVATAE